MTKQEFRELTKQQLLYLDGATGSNLIKRGMPAGVCPETWILEHPEVMIGLQREYMEAGTRVVLAPTFTSNRIKLAEYGLEQEIERINHELVGLSKSAAAEFLKSCPQERVYVAADLSMTGQQLVPMGKLELETLIDVYKEQLGYVVAAGVDLIIIETMMSLQECRAGLIAAKEVCPELPVLVTMTFEADGRALYGTEPATAVAVLQSLGADAVGANCSTGPDKMAECIRQMSDLAVIPIIAKPNAGMPKLSPEGTTYYDMPAEEYAKGMLTLIEAGATILGGCCGTSPAYIKALCDTVQSNADMLKPALGSTSHQCKEKKRYLASERSVKTFELDSPFMIVGERINPTGKKVLQEQLQKGSFDMVNDFAAAQEEQGASFLDINMGMSGIDEKQMMLKAIEEVTQTVSLPLVIDSSHIDVMEEALRRYPGRALINSISLEKVKYDHLLPIAAKYGAMFILLPLSDEGLPKNLQEKKQIIHTILERALSLGLKKEDIIVDGLVQTVGANSQAGLETLETIRYCKEELGLPTIVGLSNISFGLPERANVNSSFLTMAIQAGLTMAIANPSQRMLVSNALAADLLLHKEGADIRYIDYINALKEQYPDMAAMGTIAFKNQSDDVKSRGTVQEKHPVQKESEAADGHLHTGDQIFQSVLKGRQKSIVEITQAGLDAGLEPADILNRILMPAINEVGDLFEKGKYFLPQLIASAETMRQAIEFLEPMLAAEQQGKEMPTVVIATVAGDIHDIGKNLVALMLKNHGFRVVDLGKDVSKEKIIEAAKEHHAALIALSALMTTTMQEMRHVVTYAREQGVDAQIMIGGAVITQEYANEIGAQGYSKDAADAVKLAQRLLGLL